MGGAISTQTVTQIDRKLDRTQCLKRHQNLLNNLQCAVIWSSISLCGPALSVPMRWLNRSMFLWHYDYQNTHTHTQVPPSSFSPTAAGLWESPAQLTRIRWQLWKELLLTTTDPLSSPTHTHTHMLARAQHHSKTQALTCGVVLIPVMTFHFLNPEIKGGWISFVILKCSPSAEHQREI